MRNRTRAFVLCAVIACAAAGAALGSILLKDGLFANGGGAMTGAGRTAIATVGQVASALAADQSHEVRQGFWYHTAQFCSGADEPAGAERPRLWLSPAQPNPSRGATVFRLSIPERGHVALKLYDVAGREVARLIDGEMEAGVRTCTLEAGDLPSGIYFCRLTAGRSARTVRLALLR